MILAVSLGLALTSSVQAAEVPVSAQGHAFNPKWSADGTHLAFEVNRFEGNIDLYVVKVNNGAPVGTPSKVELPGGGSSFGGGGSIAAGAIWHPQGTMIFEGSSAGAAIRLYFWQPGGQRASQLLDNNQVSGDLTWPTLSPDGGRMAFVSDSTGDGDIYIWTQASNSVERAATSPFSEMAPGFDAAGGRLAFSRRNQGGEDLFVLDQGRSVPRIGGNGDQSRPVWVGDDSMVFFTNERGDDHWDIAVSRGPGDKKVVARDVRLPLRATPAVSSDGRWVAWGSSVPEKAGKIYLTSVEQGKTVSVETGLVAVGEPALVTVSGRTWLAYTGLPSDDATWKQLHVEEVSGKVN